MSYSGDFLICINFCNTVVVNILQHVLRVQTLKTSSNRFLANPRAVIKKTRPSSLNSLLKLLLFMIG